MKLLNKVATNNVCVYEAVPGISDPLGWPALIKVACRAKSPTDMIISGQTLAKKFHVRYLGIRFFTASA